MGYKYFYDIPVYRIPEDRYYRERDAYIDSVLFPPNSASSPMLRQREQEQPNINARMREHLAESYGGCWLFNEIVGYLRLYFLGTQVRGEYYAPNRKRIVRSRTRVLDFQTWKLAPEVDIPLPITSVGVLEAVREYIKDCKRELPKRFIDDTLFEATCDHTDWKAVLISTKNAQPVNKPDLK